MSKIIVIVGPTGVGKTLASIELAKVYGAKIINGDSVQIYKYLNVGSAKIRKDEMEGIEHYLIDYVNPDVNYSVYDYQKDGRKILNDLIKKDENIIIVGGTGLYIKALLYDYDFKKIEKFDNYEKYTNDELYELVLSKDKNTTIHKNNRKRMIMFLNRGSNSNGKNKKLYDFVTIGLTTNRDNLYNIIDKRVDNMVSDGIVEEARCLYTKYPNSRILKSAIGYKELINYFDGDISLNEAIDNIKKNSRRYAKRQYTFFNNQMDVNWFMVDYSCFENTIKDVLKFLNK